MVSVLIVRPVHVWKQSIRWQIDPVQHERALITLLARLDETDHVFMDFHLVPNIDRRKRFHITLGDAWLNRGQPLTDLRAFCQVVSSVNASRKNRSQPNESNSRHLC